MKNISVELRHEKFREFREAAGLSLSDVSYELGFKTPTGYWHIERGKRSVSATQLYLFCQTVGRNMEDFFE